MKESANLNEVSILVDGQVYKGWKSARIECSIEQISRAFALSVTDDFPGNESFRRLRPGQEAQLFIGSDVVCTGYITSTPIRYDAKSVTVQVQGKSKTVDLVDCCSPWAAIAPSGGGAGKKSDSWQDVKGVKETTKPVQPAKTVNKSWHNQTAKQIIADLCAPYSIRVVCEVKDLNTKLVNFTVNPGEKVFESINRLLTKENLIVTDNEYGDLVITEPGFAGKCSDSLEVGKNILSGSANFDLSKVFSTYVVLGQHKGSDLEFGKEVCQDKGLSVDDRMDRYRLLVIKDTGQSSNSLTKNRAEFEKNLRYAQTQQSTHAIQAWRDSKGGLWRLNSLASLSDRLLGMKGAYLISRVVFSLDSSGSKTELTSIDPTAYQRQAVKQTSSNTKKAIFSDSWSQVK